MLLSPSEPAASQAWRLVWQQAEISSGVVATGSTLPAMPMLHFVAALPAEAQSVGSLQDKTTSTQSAPDKVQPLPSLLWPELVVC